jgi:hypothetical protein
MKPLFFNLSLLENNTQCDPVLLVEKLKLHFIRKTIPKNQYSRIKPIPNLNGNSFLINATSFFDDKVTDTVYKAQYIRLAGRRDYAIYKHYGHKYLDLSYYSDINLDSIKNNPLITITQNKIYFKYEEINNGT